MNRNTLTLAAAHVADLRPLLAGFKLSATERQDLVTLRVQLVELERQLSEVSGDQVRLGLKEARGSIRSGTGSLEDLQLARRLADDKIDIRRTLKSRNAELGREAGKLLEPIFRRAVETARPQVAKLRAEAASRIRTFLPGADVDQLVRADVVLGAVEAALELLETHARSCADAQSESGRWRPSGETLDRLLASLGETLK